MNDRITKALKDAEKRLDELLPDIEKRHNESTQNSLDEPDNLKEGVVDNLGIPRVVKKQSQIGINSRRQLWKP
ncbi:hypothetical protein [Microbulbifer sp. JTAC008]|uniref:hypothetical protein n=1 Tax=unclassified Microbulbifer TaxID=2619833 RepID=UPI00403954B9